MDEANFANETDVVIIGGGITGMSVALNALQAGLKVVVFDARGLADGATGRNWGWQVPNLSSTHNDMKIQANNIQDVRNYIASLSDEWQEKIDLRVNGGLDAWGTGYGEVGEQRDMSETPLSFCETSIARGNPDLPAWATGGTETSCVAQMNPGQLVLAMAEDVQELGGLIGTQCRVTDVKEDGEGKLDVSVGCNGGATKTQKAKHVVHAWNAYGDRRTFLPERFWDYFQGGRSPVIAAKDSTTRIMQNVLFVKDGKLSAPATATSENDEIKMWDDDANVMGTIQRGDYSWIMGGCGWVDKDDIKESGEPDSYIDPASVKCLEDELDLMYPDNQATTTHAWTGMECWVGHDQKPLVGPIKELPGQYISACYSGLGMVRAYSSGQYIAELISNVPFTNPEICEEYSPERFDGGNVECQMASNLIIANVILVVSLFSWLF